MAITNAAVPDTEFVLKFSGKPNQVDAGTLLESLAGITSILHESNRELGTGERLKINVKAPKPGSFLVHLVLDPATAAAIADLFASHKELAVGGLITVLADSIAIWQFLRGKPPKSIKKIDGGSVVIENSGGETRIEDQRITNFVINNSNVAFHLGRTFSAVNADPNVTELSLLDKNRKTELVSVPREEFQELSVTTVTSPERRDITVRSKVRIVKPSFDKSLKWEIVYGGNRVSVVIADETFLGAVDHRKRFAKGDVLDVDLQVRQEFDPSLGAYLNKSYRVINVYEHLEIPDQESFGFPEDLS